MVLSARFSEACSLAASLHRNQLRKGPRRIPYMSHLLAVTAIVLEHGGTEEEAIAALLHDAVEDQGGAETLAVIRRIFGPDVAAIVLGCSDTDEQPKPPWRARKDRYLAHLAEASPSVLLVSTADKLANARTVLADYREIGEDLWSRFNGTRDETLWYYRRVVEILQTRPAPPHLVAELARVVTEIGRLVAATSGAETGTAPAR